MLLVSGIILVAVIVGIVVVLVLKNLDLSPQRKKLPYEKCASLLSPAERLFMGVLDQVVGNEYRIMAKVRLADILQAKRGLDASTRATANNRINRKHVDFVLCAPADFSMATVIELDDASHRRADRRTRDEFLDQALTDAGIPIRHFNAKRAYSVQEVREALFEAEAGDVSPESSAEPTPAADAENGDAPVCPECGADLVLRTAKKGRNAGSQFWGCSNYPSCRTMLAVE